MAAYASLNVKRGGQGLRCRAFWQNQEWFLAPVWRAVLAHGEVQGTREEQLNLGGADSLGSGFSGALQKSYLNGLCR